MKLKISPKTKSGFTIVELMFAMTFVAALLIAISVITINVTAIYQKGLAMKAVSSVGRSLIEELTTTINEAPVVDTTSLCYHLAEGTPANPAIGYANKDTCINNQAYKYVFQDRYDSTNGIQYSGVFCTGKYSYLWNTQPAIFNGQNTLTLKYRDSGGNQQVIGTIDPNPRLSKLPRLIRIKDDTHRVCTAYIEASSAGGSANWELNIMNEAKSGAANRIPTPTDGYLTAFDLDLFLYEFTIQPISQDRITLRTFMTGNFILATDTGGIDITSTGNYCKNQYRDETTGAFVSATSSLGNVGAAFNYCAINKFNFAARTAGV